MSAEQAGGAPAGVSDRMRALLSRAAEEQLHEQRQVSAVLGDLRAVLEDVDQRLATSDQVERVAAELRELTARVAVAETRAAERTSAATADLVQAVVDGVTQRLEERWQEVTALLEGTERRLSTHVDDAVLALAEVVLRRRRGAVAGASTPEAAAAGVGSTPVENAQPVEDTQPVEGVQPVEDVQPVPDVQPVEAAHPPPPETPQADHPERDGYVLVPADVPDADPEPAPPLQQERRTAERRGEQRSDGSGRRRRPWWRPA